MHSLSEEKKKAWIAVSGNIASGKSSVLAYLKKKGYPCYDCDAINAELQKTGKEGYKQIRAWLGEDILLPNQGLDKKKLAELIFTDEAAKKKLEAIMHPLISEELKKLYLKNQEVAFVEVPLLFETGMQENFDESWLVVSQQQELLERCMNNRKMSREAFLMRYRSQMPAEEKYALADVVIENNGSLNELYQQIDKLLERRGYE